MRIELSESIRVSILNYIRAGGYDWVAAEAAGIPAEVFHDWMRQGASEATGPLRDFFIEVMKARSQSRLKAEIDLRDENTLAWLRYGPGREQLGRPGWTESVSIDAKQAWDEVDRLHSEGRRIAAYGAAAKGATLLNYCGIGRERIDFVADRNTHKQGRYMPGARIPIVAVGRLICTFSGLLAAIFPETYRKTPLTMLASTFPTWVPGS